MRERRFRLWLPADPLGRPHDRRIHVSLTDLTDRTTGVAQIWTCVSKTGKQCRINVSLSPCWPHSVPWRQAALVRAEWRDLPRRRPRGTDSGPLLVGRRYAASLGFGRAAHSDSHLDRRRAPCRHTDPRARPGGIPVPRCPTFVAS